MRGFICRDYGLVLSRSHPCCQQDCHKNKNNLFHLLFLFSYCLECKDNVYDGISLFKKMKFCFPWEPVTPDLRAAGFAGSQRRQIHVQPVSLSASGSRFTCSWLRWHSADADSCAAGFAESQRMQIHVQSASLAFSGRSCTCIGFCREFRTPPGRCSLPYAIRIRAHRDIGSC